MAKYWQDILTINGPSLVTMFDCTLLSIAGPKLSFQKRPIAGPIMGAIIAPILVTWQPVLGQNKTVSKTIWAIPLADSRKPSVTFLYLMFIYLMKIKMTNK